MCGTECPSDDLFIYFLSFQRGSVMCLVEHRSWCNLVLMSCSLPTSGGPGDGGTGTGPDW